MNVCRTNDVAPKGEHGGTCPAWWPLGPLEMRDVALGSARSERVNDTIR